MFLWIIIHNYFKIFAVRISVNLLNRILDEKKNKLEKNGYLVQIKSITTWRYFSWQIVSVEMSL